MYQQVKFLEATSTCKCQVNSSLRLYLSWDVASSNVVPGVLSAPLSDVCVNVDEGPCVHGLACALPRRVTHSLSVSHRRTHDSAHMQAHGISLHATQRCCVAAEVPLSFDPYRAASSNIQRCDTCDHGLRLKFGEGVPECPLHRWAYLLDPQV